jgi:ABC-type glycerol-3-phosphate transport system substrate-binding protein
VLAGGVAALGALADLGPFLGDSSIQLTDYVPYYRDVSAVLNGQTIGIPLDGDTLLLYYRKDLFHRYSIAVPQTWDDMLAVAKYMNGTDTNGDGKPDMLGACFDIRPGKCSQGFICCSVCG